MYPGAVKFPVLNIDPWHHAVYYDTFHSEQSLGKEQLAINCQCTHNAHDFVW